MSAKAFIAKRIARELKDGDVINLGIGLPTLVSDYIPEDINVTLQSENGILGTGPLANESNRNPNIVNAGMAEVTINTGASFFDSALSFTIIRGGHVDVAVLGALQVDETGSIASHIIPGKKIPGMGGAMDLIAGSKRVIVATTHAAKDGPKILKKITLPATGIGKVKEIVTELAVMEVTPDGLLVKEIAEGVTPERLQELTEAELKFSENLITLKV